LITNLVFYFNYRSGTKLKVKKFINPPKLETYKRIIVVMCFNPIQSLQQYYLAVKYVTITV